MMLAYKIIAKTKVILSSNWTTALEYMIRQLSWKQGGPKY
jgi:hypothetical protein